MKIYIEISYNSVVSVYTDDNNTKVEVVICDNDKFNEIICRRSSGDYEDEFEEAEHAYKNLDSEEREIVDNVIGLHMERRNLNRIYF